MASTLSSTIDASPRPSLVAVLLGAPQRHYRWTWVTVFALCLAPLIVLVYEFATGNLGVNKLERLSHLTGAWALNFLLTTLAMTPLRRWSVRLARGLKVTYGRRLSDWNWLIRLRRTLGLSAFFYALIHAMIYLALELGFDFALLAREVAEKPYLIAGAATLLLLVPLAATSTNAMMRRLGGNWRRLHRLIYAAGITGILHYVWLAKIGVATPYEYAVVLAVLLGDRVVAAFSRNARQPIDDGMEAPER
jgi:sulfoxide reductase heme-binding subunit YedZ